MRSLRAHGMPPTCRGAVQRRGDMCHGGRREAPRHDNDDDVAAVEGGHGPAEEHTTAAQGADAHGCAGGCWARLRWGHPGRGAGAGAGALRRTGADTRAPTRRRHIHGCAEARSRLRRRGGGALWGRLRLGVLGLVGRREEPVEGQHARRDAGGEARSGGTLTRRPWTAFLSHARCRHALRSAKRHGRADLHHTLRGRCLLERAVRQRQVGSPGAAHDGRS
mmetsp:Transcript_87233/g.279687  ORF Transcript_87233/g.279687 Transcript_87233/m.279687 type:complete len:221 (+) Transcript_87233:722-1384(+)